MTLRKLCPSYCLAELSAELSVLQGAIAFIFPVSTTRNDHPRQAQIFSDDTLPITSLVTPNGMTFGVFKKLMAHAQLGTPLTVLEHSSPYQEKRLSSKQSLVRVTELSGRITGARPLQY
jgi:hypothetical protein